MARTVDELDQELGYPDFKEDLAAAITDARTAVHAMSPSARLGWLAKRLDELGLTTDFLDPGRALVGRTHDLQRRAVERQQQAGQSRAEALRKLVTDPNAPLDASAAEWLAAGPWLDVLPGQHKPPAVQMCYDAARAVERQIEGLLQLSGPRIFELCRGKAVEVVREVAQLPPIPEGVWTLKDAASELVKHRQHRPSWGILVAAEKDFNLAHAIADAFRDIVGYSRD